MAKQRKMKPRWAQENSGILPAETYKGLTPLDLNHIFDGVEFPTAPLWHQAVSLAWAGDERKRVHYWHDIGTGKTLTALYTAMLWGCTNIFVVCPSNVVYTWADEVRKHLRGDHFIVTLQGTTEHRRSSYNFALGHMDRDYNPKIFVINYEGLRYFFGARKQAGSNLLEYDNTPQFDKEGIDCLIVDEIHRASNPDSIQTRVLFDLSRQVPNVIGMSGSPIRKDERDLWAQYFVIDNGRSLGGNFKRFLALNYEQKGFKQVPKPGRLRAVLEAIEPLTLRFSKDECLDLPDVVRQRIIVPRATWQDRMSEELEKQFLESGNNNPAILGIKLAKICGGIIVEEGSHEGEWYTVSSRGHNPKLNYLLDLLEDIPGKVIVFHHFVLEGRGIEQALHDNDIGCVSMRGETKNKMECLRMFLEDPKVKVLVAHPACASEGINVQGVCSTVVFYSSDHSSVARKQAEGRVIRQGQKEKCCIFDLVIANSIDEVILSAVDNKQDFAEAVMQWMERR